MDPTRLYGVKQEWIDHENRHRQVWYCHLHEEEFESRAGYMKHLYDQRLEHKPEDSSPEMVAAVVVPSMNPHRDCPFCPTFFPDVATMQSHVRYHLEKLAIHSFPDIKEREGDDLVSNHPSNSHQVAKIRGRRDSVAHDFTEKELYSFVEITTNDACINQDLNQFIPFVKDSHEPEEGLGLMLPQIALGEKGTLMQWVDSSKDTQSVEYTNNAVFQDTPDPNLLEPPLPLNEGAEFKAMFSDNQDSKYSLTVLQAASAVGHMRVVRRQLTRGADPNAPGGHYGSALQIASAAGHQEIVQLLLDKGADVNARGGYYGRAIEAALVQGYEDIVRLLRDNGATSE